jgi:hypothetical protein
MRLFEEPVPKEEAGTRAGTCAVSELEEPASSSKMAVRYSSGTSERYMPRKLSAARSGWAGFGPTAQVVAWISPFLVNLRKGNFSSPLAYFPDERRARRSGVGYRLPESETQVR